ncbi:MAG: RNA polymerase sigma factor [Myxococcales bacterium]|jgi:RNA polymerase sigma-70 factor (ECF subfamily)|nr:RNA polymerase sigma factor [Myxococcales bacterium]
MSLTDPGSEGGREPSPGRALEESDPLASPARGAPDFDHTYSTYFHQVCRWLRAFGCPMAEVDDLAQETFLVVRRKLDDFDGQNLPGWLYRIAQRTASDHRRRAWFRRLFSRSSEEPDSLSAGKGDPLQSLERRRAERVLQRALERMSPKRRAAFYLFEVEGYSGEEIALLEDVPVNTVYTRIHHARKDFVRFVAELTADGPQGEAP